MKKSLTMIVASAMAFSAFASAAFADDKALDTQGKFDALKAAGIFSGYPDGSAGLDKEMTRAEFAKVLALLDGLDLNAGASSYTDVAANHWAKGYIGAVTEAKLMNGLGGGKFGPSGKVTVEQVAKVADILAGISPEGEAAGTSAWATGYVAAAVKAGLIDEMASYTGNATRSMLVDVAYDLSSDLMVQVKSVNVVDSKNVEVTFSDDKTEKVALDTALVAGQETTIKVTHDGKEYSVKVKYEGLSAKAAQTNTGEITVTFNRAATDAEKSAETFALSADGVNYSVTSAWADDKKSVVLTSTYLPAGTYSLTLKDQDPITVTIADEVATKIEIGASSLQLVDDYDLGVAVYNQFGKEMSMPSLTVKAYNASKGVEIPVDITSDDKELVDVKTANTDISKNAAVDDQVVVTAVLDNSTLSTSKTFKVVAGSAATAIKLGTVAPLDGNTRISINQNDLILPVELTDQYGQKISLPDMDSTDVGTDNKIDIGGLTFIVNDSNIIKSFRVSGGVLYFNTGATSGIATVNVLNPATGAYGSASVKVEAAAVVKTLKLNNPGTVVVNGEEVTIPYAATDSFGAQLTGGDVPVVAADYTGDKTNKVTFNSNLDFAPGYPKMDGKGKLKFKFAEEGTAYIYAYVNGAQVGNIQLTVKAAAQAVKINGVKDVAPNVAEGVYVAFDTDNVTYLDTYNRTFNVGALKAADITVDGDSATLVTNGTGDVIGIQAASDKTGTTTFTIKYSGTTNPTTNPGYAFKLNVVATSDIKSYELSSIGTVYANGDFSDSTKRTHNVGVTLVGKLSNGSTVAINQDDIMKFVSTSDPSIVGVDGDNVYGLAAGKATVTAYDGNGNKLASTDVTTSTAAPVATSISFGSDEYTLDAASESFAVNGDSDVDVTVKDQYGVAINVNGILTSSDTGVVTVNNTTKTITKVGVGSATLTYITNNNVMGTTVIVVNS